MTPDILYLLVCGGFAVGGWFVRHLGLGLPAAPGGSPLLDVLAAALSQHVANQAPPAQAPSAEATVAALLRELLLRAPGRDQAVPPAAAHP